MEVGLVGVWLTSVASITGVVYAIVRNGHRRKEQDIQLKADLKAEIQNTLKRLDDPETGLSAIKKSTDSMRLHCAEVSTRVEAQVKTNQEEIALLRKKRK